MNSPSIRLELFRHDNKESSDKRDTDEEIRFTLEWKIHATEVGLEKKWNPDMGLILASPKKRSEETAYHQLYANHTNISPEDSLEEIREKTNNWNFKKALITNLLGFTYDAKEGDFAYIDYKDHLYKAFWEEQWLKTLYKDSDDLAQLYWIPTYIDSYSRNAGNIAQIIKRYIKVFHNWKRIWKQKKYADNNELQRFLASHATITEPFLMKVISKIITEKEGKEAAKQANDTFLEQNPNGFWFSEGYTININEIEQKELSISITYQWKTYQATEKIIDEIISERDDLNASM